MSKEEALDRRAEELTNASRLFKPFSIGAEKKAYAMATRERLQDAVKSLEYMKHSDECHGVAYYLPTGDVVMHKGIDCDCGLNEHKAHLSSLLGDQITK